jgi:hypothetical protein
MDDFWYERKCAVSDAYDRLTTLQHTGNVATQAPLRSSGNTELQIASDRYGEGIVAADAVAAVL